MSSESWVDRDELNLGVAYEMFELGEFLISPDEWDANDLDPPVVDPESARIIRRGFEVLDRAVVLIGDEPKLVISALLMKSVGQRRLGDHLAAAETLRSARSPDPHDLHALAASVELSLFLGDGDDAVTYAMLLTDLYPGEAAHRANLALALVVANRIDEALVRVDEALAIDPNDEISQNLEEVILAVRDGRIARPTRWPSKLR